MRILASIVAVSLLVTGCAPAAGGSKGANTTLLVVGSTLAAASIAGLVFIDERNAGPSGGWNLRPIAETPLLLISTGLGLWVAGYGIAGLRRQAASD